MMDRLPTLHPIMTSKFSWSWPTFNVSPQQSGWRQGWKDVWREAWSETWSNPDIDVDGRGAASVRSLPEPDGALDLNDLSQRSVIALVGLAFEARIAAGPGVLVVCRGRETADLLQLAISAGCLPCCGRFWRDPRKSRRSCGWPPPPLPPMRLLFACAARWDRVSAGNEKWSSRRRGSPTYDYVHGTPHPNHRRCAGGEAEIGRGLDHCLDILE